MGAHPGPKPLGMGWDGWWKWAGSCHLALCSGGIGVCRAVLCAACVHECAQRSRLPLCGTVRRLLCRELARWAVTQSRELSK